MMELYQWLRFCSSEGDTNHFLHEDSWPLTLGNFACLGNENSAESVSPLIFGAFPVSSVHPIGMFGGLNMISS